MDAPRDQDANANGNPIDHSKPLEGAVVCCTAIPPERRIELEKKIKQLGGAHTYDLIAPVTHLIVGNYDTPKYRHVAKERYDIKVMDGRWIEALTDLWMNDAVIDLEAVEMQWQLLPLETHGPAPDEDDRGRLACSITGFHELDERQRIVDRIINNGGIYLADLDKKRVTHLIANDPKGHKYDAARKWGIYTVSLAWLDQSIERGMILDEECFNPSMPSEEQGRYAWVRPEDRINNFGKRSFSAIEPRQGPGPGQRKLRKTTSMKLGGQRDNLWGDILGGTASSTKTVFADDRVEVADSAWDLAAKHAPPEAVFYSCVFFIAGFDEWQHDIIKKVVEDLGGAILDEMGDFSMIQDSNSRGALLYVVVPQDSRPESHPEMPLPARLPVGKVTEFFIEKCLHKKILYDPKDHVLGRPFAHFPIPGFEHLALCTAGFTGIDLLHVEKCIRWMGAKYATRLNESTSVLVCLSLEDTRREKLKLALENDIPVVSAEWLWSCVATGSNLPVQKFLFSQLRQKPGIVPKPRSTQRPESRGDQEVRVKPEKRKDPASEDKSESKDEPESRGRPESRSEARRTGDDRAPTKPGTLQPAVRKPAFVDETAFKDDSVALGPNNAARVSEITRPEPVAFPRRDDFGSGTVAEPSTEPIQAVKPIPPQCPPEKPEEPKEEPATAAPIPDSGPTHDIAPASPQPEPPSAPAQDSIEDSCAKPENDDASRQREEDQKAAERAAERAALASHIMASKLNSLADKAAGELAEGNRDDDGAAAKPPRRRRGIFGRAVSNVSAASTTSHDSAALQESKAALEAAGDGLIRTRSDGALFGVSNTDFEEADSSALPSTQIGYHDAEGAQRKAELMQRMLAGEQGPGAKLPAIPKPPPRVRLPTTRVTRRSGL